MDFVPKSHPIFPVLRALTGLSPVLMGKQEKEGGFLFSLGAKSSYKKLLSPREEGYGSGETEEVLLSSAER